MSESSYKINTPPSQVERIYWVDAAKALGIFLVFWGHILYGGSEVGSVINRAIYSFHMPMYFILSGYVVKPESKPFSVYVHDKFRRILLPALILYVLTLPLFFIGKYSSMTPAEAWARVFYLHGRCAYNSPIWFFICMFQLLVIGKLLDLSNASTKKIVIFSIVSLILSFVIYNSGDLKKYLNVFGIDKCLLGLFFYQIGMLLRRIKLNNKSAILCFLAIPIWLLFGVVLNKKISMYGMQLGTFWYFIISGIAGALMFFAFSRLFEKSIILRQYAKWTVFIICSHMVLVTFFYSIASFLSIRGFYSFDILSASFVLITLLLYKYICRIIDCNFPVLNGKLK